MKWRTAGFVVVGAAEYAGSTHFGNTPVTDKILKGDKPLYSTWKCNVSETSLPPPASPLVMDQGKFHERWISASN